MRFKCMDIKETVSKIIASKVDIANVKESDSLSSLGLDSLDLVEIMLQIEETFNVEFSSDEIASLKTIEDVLKIINAKLA